MKMKRKIGGSQENMDSDWERRLSGIKTQGITWVEIEQAKRRVRLLIAATVAAILFFFVTLPFKGQNCLAGCLAVYYLFEYYVYKTAYRRYRHK